MRLIHVSQNACTLLGAKQEVTLWPQSIITFNGVEITYLVQAIHPNGVTLLDSDSSVPFFMSFSRMQKTIINDCLEVTGWMKVE